MSGKKNDHLAPKFLPSDATIIELQPKLAVNDEVLDTTERIRVPAPLLDAVESGDLAGLNRALSQERDLINVVYGPLRVTLLHIAAFHQPHLVPTLLENGANVTALDTVGRSAFYLACTAATDPKCIKALILAGADVNQKIFLPMQTWTMKKNAPEHSKKWHMKNHHHHGPHLHHSGKKADGEEDLLLNVKYPKTGIGSTLPMPECLGRTGLHQTVKAAQPECVKILIDAGAQVDPRDQKGLTPLLLAGAGVSPDDLDSLSRFEEIVRLLVAAGSDVNILNPDTGTSALHHAAARCSLVATKILVNNGAVVDKISATGATSVHEAAHSGAFQVLQYLLDSVDGMSLVNKPDHVGLTPLHKAAFGGNRACLELLLRSGGHLAILSHGGTSVLDAVFMHIARPYHFLAAILDNSVQTNNISVLDRAFKVRLDFSVLAPHGCESQTSIMREVFNSPRGPGHSLLLRHPLLETFLWLKWQRLRIFFFFLLLIYGSFLLSLSLFVVVDTQLSAYPGDLAVKQGCRYVLICTSVLLLAHVSIQTLLRPLFYVREVETWIFAFCGSVSLVIVSASSEHLQDGHIFDEAYATQLMAIVLLLAWTELMLLIGRFPTWGNYALMFYTVLRNVLKVMLTFVFIVIGFSLSFYVQFHKTPIFNNPWKAFVKTIVMMAGEFEYKDLFDYDYPATNSTSKAEAQLQELQLSFVSRMIFLIFVIVATIVMMNLMVGLAVSDIQAVQAEGHFRRLLKQAQFVDHLETIISHPIFTKCLPKCILYMLSQRRRVVTEITLQPSAVESRIRYPRKLPRRLIEACVELAVRQKAIHQLKNDEEMMGNEGSSRFSWLDGGREDQGSQANLFGVQQQAVLEEMLLRVYEELQELKNTVLVRSSLEPPLPRVFSRKESRRLNLPRGSGNENRSSRMDEAVCEVQGAHCVLRRLKE